MVAGLSALTVKQTRVWKSSIDLWSAVIRKEPERAPLAYTHRAWAFRREGRYAEALADLGRAIDLNADFSSAYLDRGLVRELLGDTDGALRGILTLLSRSRAEWVLLSLEDLWLETSPQNIPDTVNEHPNWRQKARYSIEEILRDERIAAILKLVRDARGGG